MAHRDFAVPAEAKVRRPPVKPRSAANFLISSLVPGSWKPNCAIQAQQQWWNQKQ